MIAVSIVSRSATDFTPSYRTVSPEIQSTPGPWPSQRSAKPITSPTIGPDSGGPCRHGVAVTWIDGLPGSDSVVTSQSCRPRVDPPSRLAPDAVVTTTPALSSSSRPVASRLSS
jgi:hypothetical protein